MDLEKILAKLGRVARKVRRKVRIGSFGLIYLTVAVVILVLGVILFVSPRLQKENGWLGIEVRPDTTSETLVVYKVLPESPANNVGMIVGDRILSYNGIPVSDVNILKRLIRDSYINQLVRIVIDRNGCKMVADTRILERPTNANVLPPIIPIVQGVRAPHPNRGICTNCHTILPPTK